MSQFDFKQSYRRRRPHIHPPGSTIFLTTRLAESVPRTLLNDYRIRKRQFEDAIRRQSDSTASQERYAEFQREWFRRFEGYLHRVKNGPMWLGDPDVMAMLYQRLLDGDGERYRLDAFSIMSNHLHIVFRPNLDESALTRNRDGSIENEEDTLGTIMQWLKGGSARRANQILGRTGSFWEVENFDHYIRSEADFNRIVRYVLNNPVKAGLVSRWQDWPGNFLAERLRDRFD